MNQPQEQLRNRATLCCPAHKNNPLFLVCLNKQCFSKGLLCIKCSQQQHMDHSQQIQDLNQFKRQTLKILSINQDSGHREFLNALQKAKENIGNRVKEFELLMCSLIKKVRLALNNQFETVIQSFSAETYINELKSIDEDLSTKKIINALYRILVIKRNQFNYNIQQVFNSQKQFTQVIEKSMTKFTQITSLLKSLSYIQELQLHEGRQNKMLNARLTANVQLSRKNNYNEQEKPTDYKVNHISQKINSQGNIVQKQMQIICLDSDSQKKSEKDYSRSRQKNNKFSNIVWKNLTQNNICPKNDNSEKRGGSDLFQTRETGLKRQSHLQRQMKAESLKNTKNQNIKKKQQEQNNYSQSMHCNYQKKINEQKNKTIHKINGQRNYLSKQQNSKNQQLNLKYKNVGPQSNKFNSTMSNKNEQSKKNEIKQSLKQNSMEKKKITNQLKNPGLKQMPADKNVKYNQEKKINIQNFKGKEQKQKAFQKEREKEKQKLKDKQQQKDREKGKEKEKDKKGENTQKTVKDLNNGNTLRQREKNQETEQRKRPSKKPKNMTQQQLIEWFRKAYLNKQVYSLILSHRITTEEKNKNKLEYFFYHDGCFRWETQQYLKSVDQIQRINEYKMDLKRYQKD